jgi:predicted nucleic acid-binding protein
LIVYVDTSVLLKLLVEEEGSDEAAVLWDSADALVSVRLLVVEARAALAAARRAHRLSAAQHRRAVRELASLVEQLAIVEITGELVERVGQLAERLGLRGYDAVHLAGAQLAGVDVLATADAALGRAGLRSGLHVAGTS